MFHLLFRLRIRLIYQQQSGLPASDALILLLYFLLHFTYGVVSQGTSVAVGLMNQPQSVRRTVMFVCPVTTVLTALISPSRVHQEHSRTGVVCHPLMTVLPVVLGHIVNTGARQMSLGSVMMDSTACEGPTHLLHKMGSQVGMQISNLYLTN